MFHEHNGEKFMLNFIDTPEHVDFHYEVQKALQACEGAILVVDATQGVQAQAVANAYAAIDAGLGNHSSDQQDPRLARRHARGSR